MPIKQATGEKCRKLGANISLKNWSKVQNLKMLVKKNDFNMVIALENFGKTVNFACNKF